MNKDIKFTFDKKFFDLLNRLTCRTSTYGETVANALYLAEIVDKGKLEGYSEIHVVNPVSRSYKKIVFPE